MVTQSTVCVLLCFICTDSCLSASWAHAGGKVSAEELVSARWEPSPATLSWAEMDAEEGGSPASEGHRFSARKQRLLEQETQPDRTWKPRAAMTHDGHERRKGSCPRAHPPTARHSSPSAALHPCRKEKHGDDAWIAVALGWTLPPCNVLSLMLHEMLERRRGNFKESFVGQLQNWSKKINKTEAARNPHASFKGDQGSGKKTAENNSKKWKVTWIER